MKVVVGGESNRHVDNSRGAPDAGRPLTDQFPPDLPVLDEAASVEEAKIRVKDEGTEADDESEIISVVGPLSTV